MNFVSIILPFYKKKEYIEETISSVLSQTYQNFEIIIVYDEVETNNLECINSFLKKSNKIKIIVNKKNFGAGESRNIGIEHSTGDFIAFIDADDVWHKDKLEYQIEYMLKNNAQASHTTYEIMDEKGSIISKRKAKTLDYENLLLSCDIGLFSVILKKEILNEDCKFANLNTKEDYVLWLKLSKKGINFYGIDKTLLKWRKLENSLSSSTFRKLLDGFYVYNKYLNFSFIKSFFHLFRLSINFLKKK